MVSSPAAPSLAFRAKWAELVEAGAPFLIAGTSGQQAADENAPQTLSAPHLQRRPEARPCLRDRQQHPRERPPSWAADPDRCAGRFRGDLLQPPFDQQRDQLPRRWNRLCE